MRSSEKSIPPDRPAPVDPEVSIFRDIALLNLPEPWRPALRQLGEHLFKLSMERFGIANECEGSPEITAARVQALAADLRCTAEQLASMGFEAEDVELIEARLCRLAGRMARPVFEVADKLDRGALDVLEPIEDDSTPEVPVVEP